MSDPLEDAFGNKELRQEALKAISDAIDPAAHDGLMEIELLGQPMFPPRVFVLRDGSAIAVNKKGLKYAYLEALEDVRRAGYALDTAAHSPEPDTVAVNLKALAVPILLQPEYLTAINLRKMLLRSVKIEARPGPERYGKLLELEKRFIDSLLTSPLDKHNKSPTVWSHRRWLVPRLAECGLLDIRSDLAGVVMVAGEKHPRNYYAWHHARYLMTFVDWNCDRTRQDILEAVLDWCKRHHDDTSGWSFLQSLLVTEGRYGQERVTYVLQDVLRLARSLRWTNESVWVFLRTIAACKVCPDQEFRDLLQTIAALQAGADDATAEKVLHAAASWCADYRGKDRELGT